MPKFEMEGWRTTDYDGTRCPKCGALCDRVFSVGDIEAVIDDTMTCSRGVCPTCGHRWSELYALRAIIEDHKVSHCVPCTTLSNYLLRRALVVFGAADLEGHPLAQDIRAYLEAQER